MRLTKATTALINLNLFMQVLIIITGGAVRLTGSGLGCSTWPMCEPGQFTSVQHPAMSIHPHIEFSNRVISAVVVAVAVAVFVAVWRQRDQRSRGFLILSSLPAFGVLLQAGLGGVTVLTELHPAIVGSHFLFSAALVWVSTWLVVRWYRGDGPVQHFATPPVPALATSLAILAGAIVVLGMIVTGSGPHSGDPDAPYRFAINPYRITQIHSITMWVFIAVFAVYAWVIYSRSKSIPEYKPVVKGAAWVAGSVALQAALGYWQYFAGLPEGVVLGHLLGASLFIIAVTYALLALRPRATSS